MCEIKRDACLGILTVLIVLSGILLQQKVVPFHRLQSELHNDEWSLSNTLTFVGDSLQIWPGIWISDWVYRYGRPPKDNRNLSVELRTFLTCSIINRLVFPPPEKDEFYLDYYRWATDHCLNVFVPIPINDPKCHITMSHNITIPKNMKTIEFNSFNSKIRLQTSLVSYKAAWIDATRKQTNINNKDTKDVIFMIHGM